MYIIFGAFGAIKLKNLNNKISTCDVINEF